MFSYSLSKRICLNPAAPNVSCVSPKIASSFWPNGIFTFSQPPSTAFICVFSVFTALLPGPPDIPSSFLPISANLDDLALSLHAIVSGAHFQTFCCLFSDKTKWCWHRNARRNLPSGFCWKLSSDHYQRCNTESTLTCKRSHAYVYQFAWDAVVYSTYTQIRRHTSEKLIFRAHFRLYQANCSYRVFLIKTVEYSWMDRLKTPSLGCLRCCSEHFVSCSKSVFTGAFVG